MSDSFTNVGYASPVVGRNYWPEAILAVIGLGLVALGGCFLIGIATMYDAFAINPGPADDWTVGKTTFVGVLYACCLACIVAAAIVLVMTVSRLIRR